MSFFCVLGVVKVTVALLPPQHCLEENQRGTSKLGGDRACPWVDSHFSVAGLWEAPTVTTPEMLVGANSSTHPESKQRVVAEVKPQEVTHGYTGAVPIHSSQRSLGMGQTVKGLVCLAKETGAAGIRLAHVDGEHIEQYQHDARGAVLSLTPPLLLGRYSAVRPLLADLEQETRAALKTLYGFSEIESRKRREAEPWSSALGGAQPKFLNLIPLMIFDEGETRKATDFLTGRKRKISGSIIHKTADVMHVQESKEVVGFQLVSTRDHGLEHGVGWR